LLLIALFLETRTRTHHLIARGFLQLSASRYETEFRSLVNGSDFEGGRSFDRSSTATQAAALGSQPFHGSGPQSPTPLTLVIRSWTVLVSNMPLKLTKTLRTPVSELRSPPSVFAA